jgi:hypothetical protein
MKTGMEKHMEILIQLLIYTYNRNGWTKAENNVREKNILGMKSIHYGIINKLK